MSTYDRRPHPHSQQTITMPSLEEDDCCSETDTVLYTPTLSVSASHQHCPPWSSTTAIDSRQNNRLSSSSSLSNITREYKSAEFIHDPSFMLKEGLFFSPQTLPESSSSPTSPTSASPTHFNHNDHDDNPLADQYQTVIRRVSQHIDNFLFSRENIHTDVANDQENPPDHDLEDSLAEDHPDGPSSLSPHPLIALIHQFRDTSLSTRNTQGAEVCDAMLAWLHQQDTPKQKKEWMLQLEEEQQARQEAEETVEAVRIEMENMMEELEQTKQKLFVAQQEAQDVREQWTDWVDRQLDNTKNDNERDRTSAWALLSMQQQDWEARWIAITTELEEHKKTIQRYRDERRKENEEKRQMKMQLEQAERTAAEYDLKLVVWKSQQKKLQEEQSYQHKIKHHNSQEKDELIKALQRHIVEKESSLAQWEKKWKEQVKQWDNQQIALQQAHLADQQALKEEYKAQYQKEADITLIRVTRDTRALEGELAEMTTNQERLEGCLIQYQKQQQQLEEWNRNREAQWSARQIEWEGVEKDLRASILCLEQKIITLDEETVRLYGKNIMLANQLGECE